MCQVKDLWNKRKRRKATSIRKIHFNKEEEARGLGWWHSLSYLRAQGRMNWTDEILRMISTVECKCNREMKGLPAALQAHFMSASINSHQKRLSL